MLRRLLIAIVTVSAVGVTSGAEVEPAEAGSGNREASLIYRLRLSEPQRFSVGVGSIWSRREHDSECGVVCRYRGFHLAVEPGISGGKLSMGFAELFARRAAEREILRDVFLGYGVRGTLLRTWGDSELRPSSQTYVGAEGVFTVIRINFSLSILRRVNSRADGDPWLTTGGIGWGF